MAYHITNYTKEQARRHNVIVKPAKNPKKKINRFKTAKNTLIVKSKIFE